MRLLVFALAAQFLLFGALIYFAVAGWPFWAALAATLALVALIGYLLESQVMRRIAGQPQFAGVMLTLGIAFMLRGLVSMGFGPQERKYETPFSGHTTRLGEVVVTDLNLAIVAVAIAVTVALYLFLTRTAVGGVTNGDANFCAVNSGSNARARIETPSGCIRVPIALRRKRRN